MYALDRLSPIFVLGGALFGALALQPVLAEEVSQDASFEGEMITILVGLAPGGIYDLSARLVANHIGEYIPGHPEVIVENQPGGGGLLVANRLYNSGVGDDGTTIALLQRSLPLLPLQGSTEAQFDGSAFQWIGSLSAYQDDAYLVLINGDHPAETAEDLISGGESAVFGTGNVGSSSRIFTNIAVEVLGLDIEPVTGYQGAAPIFLAMEQDEVDGQTIDRSAVIAQQRSAWEAGQLRALVQFGRTERAEGLEDVPTARELAPDEEALALIDFAEIPFFMSTPFAASPRLSDERREVLETAFLEMASDPDFLAEAERIGIEVNAIGGSEILELLDIAAQTPPEVIERYNTVTELVTE